MMAFANSLCGIELNFKQQIETAKTSLFQHVKTKSGKIYEFTKIHYIATQKNKIPYKIEIIEKFKPDNRPFLTKTIWFNSQTGRAIRSEEIDNNSGFTISSLYGKSDIRLLFIKNNNPKKLKFSMEKNLVPAGLIIHWLRKKLPLLLRGKTVNFILLLPRIAYQLNDARLPPDLAKLKVKATINKKVKWRVKGRIIEAVQVLIKPNSFLLKRILPAEQTTFQFTFAVNQPFILLGFREKNIISTLVDE